MPRVKTKLVRVAGPPPLLELAIRFAARRLNRLPDSSIATLQSLPFELAERILAAVIERGDLSAINFLVTIGLPVESLDLHRFARTGRILFENLARSPVSFSLRSIAFPMDADDGELALVAAVCPRLERVDLTGCLDVTLEGICALLRARPGIRELLAFNSARVSTADPYFDAAAFAGLESLSLGSGSRLTDEALAAVVGRCPQLASLSLRECWRLSDVALAPLAGCPRLRSIALSDCKEVSDFGLARLARACPGLAELDLKNLEQVTDLALARVAACLPRLELLHLERIPKVTDEGVLLVARACGPLCSLALRHLDSCSGKLLDELAALPRPALSSLQHLSLASLQVSDAALCSLAARSPLATLSVLGCAVQRGPGRPDLARALRAARGAALEVEADGSLPEVVDFACSSQPEAEG